MISDSTRRSPRAKRRFRAGFTLVELLVVMAIIVALSAIMLAFLPKTESKLAADGAAMLQTWLGAARSRAVRDQAPTGLRLLPSTATGAPAGSFGSVQLIQTPEPFTWPGVQIFVPLPTGTPPKYQATFQLAPIPPSTIVGKLPNNFNLVGPPAVVQAGDYLEITYGVGSIHQVAPNGVQAVNHTLGQETITLLSQPPAAAITPLTTTNWRVIRQPQPLMGEPAQEFPNTVVVYPNSSPNPSTPPASVNLPTTPNVDIIFGPSGQVINATSGRIVLWVWDINQVSQPTLLTIYTNTGFVAAHPLNANTTLGGPYYFTQDGQNSGF